MRLRRLSCLLLASLLFICVVYSALPYGLVGAAEIANFELVTLDTSNGSVTVLSTDYDRPNDPGYLLGCSDLTLIDACTTFNDSNLPFTFSSDGSTLIEFNSNRTRYYFTSGTNKTISPQMFVNTWDYYLLVNFDTGYVLLMQKSASSSAYSCVTNTAFTDALLQLVPPDIASEPVFSQNLPEGTGTVPYTVNYTVGQAAEPLTVAAESTDGGTITYQWYQYGEDTSPIIPNATDASFTPPTDIAGETTYYCQVTNTISSGSIKTLNSNHVKVVVSAAPVPTPDPDDPDTAIKDGIDNISDQLTELPGAIGDRVDQAADSLGNKILDGIKGLFVPDEEDIADIKDKWEQLLSERFGAVYESATIIDSIVDAFVYNGDMATISFPSVTVDLAGTPFTFGGWEVEVVPERFRFLTTTSKLITSIVCTVLFVNGMKKKLEGLLAA